MCTCQSDCESVYINVWRARLNLNASLYNNDVCMYNNITYTSLRMIRTMYKLNPVCVMVSCVISGVGLNIYQ